MTKLTIKPLSLAPLLRRPVDKRVSVYECEDTHARNIKRAALDAAGNSHTPVLHALD